MGEKSGRFFHTKFFQDLFLRRKFAKIGSIKEKAHRNNHSHEWAREKERREDWEGSSRETKAIRKKKGQLGALLERAVYTDVNFITNSTGDRLHSIM